MPKNNEENRQGDKKQKYNNKPPCSQGGKHNEIQFKLTVIRI